MEDDLKMLIPSYKVNLSFIASTFNVTRRRVVEFESVFFLRLAAIDVQL